jgi:hypothetical protein
MDLDLLRFTSPSDEKLLLAFIMSDSLLKGEIYWGKYLRLR